MWALRLGIITSLLSPALVSGFTTAAASHTTSAQLLDLFGMKNERKGGLFNLPLVNPARTRP